MKKPICLLVDNGTLRPEPILMLRSMAKKLELETSFEVISMGLLHSNKVNQELLNGIAGQTIDTFLRSDRGQNITDLLILPFFLGPSRGINDWLVDKLTQWTKEKEGREFKILNCLYEEGDDRLSKALAWEIKEIQEQNSLHCPSIAMVDHGTPIIAVNMVREMVGKDLKKIINKSTQKFSTCSMERREGQEYDFNEPLLEAILSQWAKIGIKDIIISLFFLLAGRHAGENGDIENICKFVKQSHPNVRIFITKPLGGNKIIYELLKERLECAFNKSSK
ncbi:MAG: hypothetical protein CMI23_03525 [Opitutae bacterium]|nr:hypothetical protein [Opitutae bacterium]|tara:strand:- start:5099 stop:5935 length:837 start_codon:yes stop_codon:yes gene_type:complete